MFIQSVYFLEIKTNVIIAWLVIERNKRNVFILKIDPINMKRAKVFSLLYFLAQIFFILKNTFYNNV